MLLVSHDPAFLNNIVTQTLVFEGDGVVKEYAGGYDDWLLQRGPVTSGPTAVPKKAATVSSPAAVSKSRTLTYKEQRELEQLPHQIEDWEAEQDAIHQAMAAPGYYQQDSAAIARTTQQLDELHDRLAAAYERWQLLEALSATTK